MTWDRNAELNALASRNLDGANLAIAKMWIFHHDLEIQSETYAKAKTYAARMRSTLIVSYTSGEGKLSVSAAEHAADSDTDVWNAALAYRLAEQMITADREALKILHAELDAFRTARADARVADEFQARVA